MVIGAGLLPLASHAGDWWIMGGPALRGGMDVKITGSSYAQMQGLNTDAGIGIGNAGAYGDRICERQLDRLMERYKDSNADFYGAYQVARLIVMRGAGAAHRPCRRLRPRHRRNKIIKNQNL